MTEDEVVNERLYILGSWLLAAILGAALTIAVGLAVMSNNSPQETETTTQPVLKTVCVESHYEYRFAYEKDSWPTFQNLSEEMVLQKDNYSSDLWVTLNGSYVDTPDRLRYERVKICDEKINKTVEMEWQ